MAPPDTAGGMNYLSCSEGAIPGGLSSRAGLASFAGRAGLAGREGLASRAGQGSRKGWF